jgi:hypothetical protein
MHPGVQSIGDGTMFQASRVSKLSGGERIGLETDSHLLVAHPAGSREAIPAIHHALESGATAGFTQGLPSAASKGEKDTDSNAIAHWPDGISVELPKKGQLPPARSPGRRW